MNPIPDLQIDGQSVGSVTQIELDIDPTNGTLMIDKIHVRERLVACTPLAELALAAWRVKGGSPALLETDEVLRRRLRASRPISQGLTSKDLETITDCLRAGIITQKDLDNILPVALPRPERVQEPEPRREWLTDEGILEWREPKPVPSCWERILAWAEHPDEDL